jgi:hypothetical protein
MTLPRFTMAPAPVIASSPMVLGATMTEPLPMNARAPIFVSCLCTPS